MGGLVGLPLCPSARPGPPRLQAMGGRGYVTRCVSHEPRALATVCLALPRAPRCVSPCKARPGPPRSVRRARPPPRCLCVAPPPPPEAGEVGRVWRDGDWALAPAKGAGGVPPQLIHQAVAVEASALCPEVGGTRRG